MQIPAFLRRGVPAPALVPVGPPPLRGVWLERGELCITWGPGDPLFAQLRMTMRAIPGRRWDPERRCWVLPVTTQTAAALLSMADSFGFQVREKARAAMEGAGRAADRAEASRALDADDIDIPGLVGALMPFQRAGVRYALDAERCFVSDEVGLGKTWEAFATVEAADAYPAIVVCPAKMRRVWARELALHLPSRTVQIVMGTTALPSDSYDADYLIVGQDTLHAHTDGLIACNPQAVIVDESHSFKTPRARRTKALLALAGAGPRIRLCLTGTPLPNRPMELYPQLAFLGQLDAMGGEKAFRWRYDRAWVGDYDLVRLHEMLRANCYLRRRKADVWPELPAVQVSAVEADVRSSEDYQSASADLEDAAAAFRIAADQSARAEWRGAAMGAISQMRQAVGIAKIPAALDWVRDFFDGGGEKLIVFAHHVEVQRQIAEALPGCARIVAGMSDSELMAEVDRFQGDPACAVIVCSLLAGGQGLTLTAASHMLIVEFPWVPKDLTQAHGRAHGRVSDAHGLSAYHLHAPGTLDELVMGILERKLRVTTAVQDGQILNAADTGRSIMGEILDSYLGPSNTDAEELDNGSDLD